MQRLYEQQLAGLVGLSGLNQMPAAASNLLAYNNPYMMASLAGLAGGFPGLSAAPSGLAGVGGVSGTDYQAAMAAMSAGYPTAGELLCSTVSVTPVRVESALGLSLTDLEDAWKHCAEIAPFAERRGSSDILCWQTDCEERRASVPNGLLTKAPEMEQKNDSSLFQLCIVRCSSQSANSKYFCI